MSDATGEADAYQIVLRDLRAKRSKIDDAISAIERVLGINPPDATRHSAPISESPSAPDSQESPSEAVSIPVEKKASVSYAGLTIYEAAKQELDRLQRELSNAEITDGIQENGLKLNSTDPYNTVASVLTRRFYDHGDIVRVGRGTWGLPEWYSEQDFRAEALSKRESRNAKSHKNASAKSSTSEPEQPSEPRPSAPQSLDEWLGFGRPPNRA